MSKLHTENVPGNLHAAASTVNKWGWADYVVAMDFSTGYTVVVFRMPDELVWDIRRNSQSYAADPHHDDPSVRTER
jgi:hypothetical protein